MYFHYNEVEVYCGLLQNFYQFWSTALVHWSSIALHSNLNSAYHSQTFQKFHQPGFYSSSFIDNAQLHVQCSHISITASFAPPWRYQRLNWLFLFLLFCYSSSCTLCLNMDVLEQATVAANRNTLLVSRTLEIKSLVSLSCWRAAIIPSPRGSSWDRAPSAQYPLEHLHQTDTSSLS